MGGREVGGMSFCVRYAAVPPCIMPATFRFNVRKGGCKERREKDGTSQHMSSVTTAPAERNATVVGVLPAPTCFERRHSVESRGEARFPKTVQCRDPCRDLNQ